MKICDQFPDHPLLHKTLSSFQGDLAAVREWYDQLGDALRQLTPADRKIIRLTRCYHEKRAAAKKALNTETLPKIHRGSYYIKKGKTVYPPQYCKWCNAIIPASKTSSNRVAKQYCNRQCQSLFMRTQWQRAKKEAGFD